MFRSTNRSNGLLLVILLAIFLITVIPVNHANASSGTSTVNPAWIFHNSIYGKDTSGSYVEGIMVVHYWAVFNGVELLTVSRGGIGNQTYVVSKDQYDNFDVSPVGTSGGAFVVTKYLNTTGTTTPAFLQNKDPTWMYGATDNDNTAFIEGAYVWYQYNGGTYPNSDSTLAIWLGIYTNTGYFMQVAAAWGGVNCGKTALSAPIFSIGYGSSLGNCPIATAVQGHQYVMQVAYDSHLVGEWYFLIFDETSESYVLPIDYISSATGTYIPVGDTFANMEGIYCSSGCPEPNGSYIPNDKQYFYNLQYWTAQTQYNWVNWQKYTAVGTGFVPPPSNVALKVNEPSGYVTSVYWCYNSC